MSASSVHDRDFGNAVQSSTTGDTGLSLDPLGDLGWSYALDPLGRHETDELSLPSDRLTALAGLSELAEDANIESASLDMLTPAERRAQSNKLAQRRARARKKARAEGAEAQLAVTSAELQELQNKQKALQARNSLLEKIVQLEQPQHQQQQPAETQALFPAPVSFMNMQNRSPTTHKSNLAKALYLQDFQDLRKVCGFKDLPGPAAKLLATQKAVKLTVHPDKEQIIHLEDFAKISLNTLAKIYTVSSLLTPVSCMRHT